MPGWCPSESSFRFRDAELCSIALHETFTGRRSYADAMADFVSLTAGTVSPVEFFAAENIKRIFGAAQAAYAT
ncbi:MAG TPA: hypothetical protein VGS60_17330 [Actinomycetes bacterium]|nr:hypothetical protein [Actinomycetes bacterium]